MAISLVNQTAAIGLAAVLTALVAPAAHADYLTGYDDWSRLTLPEKNGYAMGLFDGDQAVFVVNGKSNPNEQALKSGVNDCFVAEKIESPHALQMIEDGYKNAAERDKSPAWVFSDEIAKTCREYINTRRAKLNLAPIR
jgi:hypothetical protein